MQQLTNPNNCKLTGIRNGYQEQKNKNTFCDLYETANYLKDNFQTIHIRNV